MNKQQILIDQIHSEFDQAQDKLLSEARSVLANIPNESTMRQIAERQKSLGFINTETVKKANKISELLVKTKDQADVIEYYKNSYPFLKFLTESELDRICKKYNLVYNPVQNYIRDVPEKNLRDIEQAQKLNVRDLPENKIWCELKRDASWMLMPFASPWMSIYGSDWHKFPKRIDNIHFRDKWAACRHLNTAFGIDALCSVESVENFFEDRQGLFICAPAKDFAGNKWGLSSFVAPAPKDPIVFRYVRGGIQVLTKWGLEANDPALVVPILN